MYIYGRGYNLYYIYTMYTIYLYNYKYTYLLLFIIDIIDRIYFMIDVMYVYNNNIYCVIKSNVTDNMI